MFQSRDMPKSQSKHLNIWEFDPSLRLHFERRNNPGQRGALEFLDLGIALRKCIILETAVAYDTQLIRVGLVCIMWCYCMQQDHTPYAARDLSALLAV